MDPMMSLLTGTHAHTHTHLAKFLSLSLSFSMCLSLYPPLGFRHVLVSVVVRAPVSGFAPLLVLASTH